ncbi:MAG: hypothetical protein KAT15_23400, partial [Bacteroidales bacterium]|nr:hypothetical protein [Bacteroidales bacterium]
MILRDKVFSSIIELSQTEYDPFYIYDSSRIRSNCRMFLDIPYENKSIHYATMANIHPEFLAIVKDENIYV